MTPRVLAVYCNARPGKQHGARTFAVRNVGDLWRCHRCGARVKVAW